MISNKSKFAAAATILVALSACADAGGTAANNQGALGANPDLATEEMLAKRNVAEYNLKEGLAIQGYDPVAYFPEGGGQLAKGDERLKLEYLGVTYHFSSAENMELFVQNPNKYEPSYGGWCAFAMSTGNKVRIQPQYYTLSGNRLHLFVNPGVKQTFDSDVAGHEERADGFWKMISGEEPRK